MAPVIQPPLGTAFRPHALGLAALWIMTLICSAAPTHAQERPTPLERRVKAAFVYKFTGYINWPPAAFASTDSVFVIGVIGDDEFEDDLSRTVKGRTVEGRPIEVRSIDEMSGAGTPQVLYVAGTDPRPLRRAIAMLGAKPCLIITERRGALAQGSVINFLLDNGHVRFEISKAAADSRGLTLSSQLLGVAQVVVTELR